MAPVEMWGCWGGVWGGFMASISLQILVAQLCLPGCLCGDYRCGDGISELCPVV